MELYKRYRPKNLNRVVGNATTIKALSTMLENDRIPHAMLFHGPSGCGKTTLARIVKDELECHDMDFVEINSSSFRGIDTIREIQSTMRLAPSGGKCRVWLLDEVHKLSNDAQNAALKMMEDMPAHVYFLLCTTQPGKLLTELRNRCTALAVTALGEEELAKVLDFVIAREGIELGDKVKERIIDAAAGSSRLALVLLEFVSNLPADKQLAAIHEEAENQIIAIDLARALLAKTPWKGVAKILKELAPKVEPEELRRGILAYMHKVLLDKGEFRAYELIRIFENPFYDSGGPGLVAACFEACHGVK